MGCGTKLGGWAATHETRKTVTALFCDLVGSTSLGERHDPEVLRPLLEAYFTAASEAIERHGGHLEKFIGDAVCAVFGLPVAHEDDALRAVRAGLEIQERLARMREAGPIALEVRVGITTGNVLVSSGAASLVGDTMNTASRVQSGAEPGQVLIGEPTWRLVRDAVEAEAAPALAAKGKAEPVPVWRVAALADGPGRRRRLDAPMVGRERESQALAAAYQRVLGTGASARFTVLGAAGAGKSRFVDEFLRTVEGDADVLRGRCSSYGDAVTWLPLAEALRPALGLATFAERHEVEGAIRAAADATGPDAGLVASGLGGLFGLAGSGSAEQSAWAVRRLLEARARDRPVVLVLDDLQWADAALLDLVEDLGSRARAPILTLGMARPDLLDARPGWGSPDDVTGVVRLDALGPADGDALVDGLLGGATLPVDVRARIVSAAGGNPLFTEEIVRMLVDDGHLVREEGAWTVVEGLDAIRIPPTVSALLGSRLDRLAATERAVLEAASIEGQSFSSGALEALLPDAARELPGIVAELVRQELVVPEDRSGPGGAGHRFRHLLIRDAAYDAIPKASRARLHLAYADWLEATAGDAIAEHREVVGTHLTQAHRYRAELGQPDDPALRLRAARALAEAGSRAYDDLGDPAGAVRLLTAAVMLAPATAETACWDERAWNIGFIVHQRPVDSRPRDVNGEVYGAEIGDLVAARDRRIQREFADPSSIDRTTGLPADLAALERYRSIGARHLEPGVLLRLEQGAYFVGDPVATVTWARQALTAAEALGWRDVVQWAAGDLLGALILGPEPLSRYVAEAEALLQRWTGRLTARTALVARAHGRALMGDAAGAQADLDESTRIREALGIPADTDDLWVQVPVLQAAGDLERAAAICREALARIPAEDALNRNSLLAGYARILLDLGQDADAMTAIAPLRDSAIAEQRVTGRTIRARILARSGAMVEARAAIDDAWALAEPTGLAELKAYLALDRAHVRYAAGDAAGALAAAADALARFRVKEHAVGVAAVESLLDSMGDAR